MTQYRFPYNHPPPTDFVMIISSLQVCHMLGIRNNVLPLYHFKNWALNILTHSHKFMRKPCIHEQVQRAVPKNYQ